LIGSKKILTKNKRKELGEPLGPGTFKNSKHHCFLCYCKKLKESSEWTQAKEEP
jgi:hypothetical protein